MRARVVEMRQRVAVVFPAIEVKLSALLKEVTRGVRPADWMIRFYNLIGRLPFHLGPIILFLTSIDPIRVICQVGILGRTDAALRVIYDYRFRPWRLLWSLGDALWQGAFNCRSVRARGRFVQKAVRLLLGHLARERASHDGSARLTTVSLGSGSASQLLQGVADNGFNANDIQIVLVDHDARALEAGHKNACRLGFETAVELRETMIGRFLRNAVLESVDLFEMVGLADYFKDHQLRWYLRGIRAALAPKGLLLGSNISNREEAAYAHGAACWPPMHYRSREELLKLLREAGFEQIWTGACGLYMVWVAQKASIDPC